MSTLSAQYRQMAVQARTDADAARLPNVQQVHLQSAERLHQMVLEIENVARAKARNDAAKDAEITARN